MHHVFTHNFDYIVLGTLIASMIVAAAKVLTSGAGRGRIS